MLIQEEIKTETPFHDNTGAVQICPEYLKGGKKTLF